MESNEMEMHEKYLPFTEHQLREHFVEVKQSEESDDTEERHIEYYSKSIQEYNDYFNNKQVSKSKSFVEMRKPRQIEKDERFWTAACLMTIYHNERHRVKQFIQLLSQTYRNVFPLGELNTWEECFKGKLHLFFEPNLPSPKLYKSWLKDNLRKRQFIPYILESAVNSKENLEGPTHVDAMILNSDNGFAVIIEAKVLSDISYQITYDVMRNQIARNIDVMLENNGNLCKTLKSRKPEKTLFLLLTPKCFKEKENWRSRLYGYKFKEYKNNPESLALDLPHREGVDWQVVSEKLGWLTWEDFKEVNKDCCIWLDEIRGL